MADYFTQATITPFIPNKYITKSEISLLRRFGFLFNKSTKGYYFYASDYIAPSTKGEDENVLCAILQEIIKRSEGNLPFIYIQGAYGCTVMRPDSHGGFAIFVTEKKVKYFSTYRWINKQIFQTKKKIEYN